MLTIFVYFVREPSTSNIQTSVSNIYFSQYALLSSNVIFCYLKYRLDRYGYYQIHTLTTDPRSNFGVLLFLSPSSVSFGHSTHSIWLI